MVAWVEMVRHRKRARSEVKTGENAVTLEV
jgi:hypothetical protein